MMVKCLIFIGILFVFHQADPYKGERDQMVKVQIERRGIQESNVLKAMREVKRHLFVPDDYRKNAYDDRPLPIGYGQTISQPYIVAYMTEVISPEPYFKVLEIGTGSGYQAAVLAEIVDEVYTIEIVKELGTSAAKRLESLGFDNIKVKVGDGYYGWEERAPFDAIVVTAAAEFVPPPLIEQLKDGGKMIIPVGSPFMTQMLSLVEKKNGKPRTKTLMPVRFVPFTRSK
ncbi:protein-L-isoaspartate(D-aspartate) O-methyltransferase [Echinicola sediminis]